LNSKNKFSTFLTRDVDSSRLDMLNKFKEINKALNNIFLKKDMSKIAQ
jgi:hypothetical protein